MRNAREFSLRCVGTASAVLASGCSLIPDYHRPAAAVADTYPTGPAYVSAIRAGAPAASETGWRDFFADLRLQELIATALQSNRDLRTAILNVELLRAQFRIQSAQLLPQVAVSAVGTRSRAPAQVALPGSGDIRQRDSYLVGATFAWEIDLFGRLRSLKAAALEEYLASVEARKGFEILLVSQVADQYLLMLANDELLEVTQRTLDVALASFALVKLQFDTGVATELDLRQAETVVEQGRSNRLAQLRAHAQAENGLILLLGQPLPATAAPTTRLDGQRLLAEIPAGVPSELLTRRPDVLQAEALLRSANANIGAARAAFFPFISLTGTGGTASTRLNDLFRAGSAAWSLSPAIDLSIFDAGANSANLDAARVAREIGIARYQLTIQTAFREVADGLAARGTFDEQIRSLERLTAAQRRRLELAQLLYRNGQASYLDVLTAQNDLYDAELVLVAARLQRLTNLVDLYRALGGGWLEHTGEEPRTGDAQMSSGTAAAK
jgi:outer membrane protein, multidrug efflux system